MNETPSTHPIEAALRQAMGEVQNYVRREPCTAVTAAFGVGMLVNLVPSRVLVGALTAVGVTLLRPTLMTLGVAKAFELCCSQSNSNPRTL